MSMRHRFDKQNALFRFDDRHADGAHARDFHETQGHRGHDHGHHGHRGHWERDCGDDGAQPVAAAPLRIMLVNDDSYTAEGIAEMRDALLAQGYSVTVVAPKDWQSV